MKARIGSVAKSLSYVIVAFIIVAAFFVVATRLFTPMLGTHRVEFEKWASDLLAMPVKIEQLEISWYGYQPGIRFNRVVILNKETLHPALEIKRVNVFFSIPKSIWQMKVVPSAIMIDGTSVDIMESATGELSLKGFPAFAGFEGQPLSSETKINDIMTLLSSQPRLILRDVDIRFTNKTEQQRRVTLYNLNFENNGENHLILGKAILHQDIPTEMSAIVRWNGKTFDPNVIRARIYLYVSGFSLSQWMKDRTWHGWQVNNGLVSAKIWATWNHGRFQKIQSTFQSYALKLFSEYDQSIHQFNRLSGNIGWKREGENQIFAGDDILIDLPTRLWPVTSFYVSLAPNATGNLEPKIATVGYLDLTDVQTFLSSLPPILPDETKKMLSELKLEGTLQNTVLTATGPLSDWKNISLNTNFNGIAFAPYKNFPGIKNVSGTLKWQGQSGSLSLNSNRTSLQLDSIFENPILIDQLIGDLQWKWGSDNSLSITIPALQILNNDLAANVNGSFTLPKVGSPLVDLRANFTMQKVVNISRYLPLKTFDKNLTTWLKQAFLAGEIPSGNAEFQGAIHDFPFTNGKGHFQISGTVNNLNLRYAPDWPELKHVNGNVNFTGNKMTVEINHGQILNISLPHVRGEIPDLGADKSVLLVDGEEIKSDLAEGLKFVHASPLEKTIGKMFSRVELSGPMKLKLGLKVPLSNGENTEVSGDLTIKEAEMKLVPWKLTLDKLTGLIRFTEKNTEAKNVVGKLFNRPLQLDLSTIQKTQTLSIVRASFKNRLNIEDLQGWLQVPFSKVAKGESDVNGEIDFSLNEPIVIRLRSQLKGIALTLPAPYEKGADEEKNFSSEIIVQENQPLKMKLHYDNLSAALVLDRKQDIFQLISATLQLGSGEPNWPQSPGLYISGNFDQLDWDTIKSHLSQSTPSNQSFGGLTLHGINIAVRTLTILGLKISQLHLQAIPENNKWKITITSPDIAGQVEAPMNLTPQGVINAQFQKLSLHTATHSLSSKSSIDVKTLPSINFQANNVSYNNMSLGEITFRTIPAANGFHIQKLRINSQLATLEAVGEWTKTNTTHLEGRATSPNVSDFLSNLGFDVHNFVSSNGKVDFDLNWRDAPFAFSPANLNGRASLDMGKGRIVDVGQESGAKMDLGRMLSIFSLQTIPRRLKLDFSDLFEKGYSFDYVRGNFTFREGNAFTSDLQFNGPVAHVQINGRIGLKNKDYDFTLSVTPYVTSSLPVAATLLAAGNPVVGLAAVAVNTVISSGVSKVTSHYYSVKGPWGNPVWQSVGEPKSGNQQQN